MSGSGVMRVKKLKGNGIITVAARHNRRVIQAELGAAGSIDSTRSCLNETLAGPSTAADVGQLAKDLMTAAGVAKLRKDAVMGLEIVFSLPPGHNIDDRAYFTACAEWAGLALGGAENVLSADIHRDEAAPHCHVLLLPLIDARMDGSNLIGGKQKLMALQKDFHEKVASRFGLSKAPVRQSGTAKQAAVKAVLQTLRETSDAALRSAAWAVIRQAVEHDPGPFLRALGIEAPTPQIKLKPFVDYVTSKGKGPAKESSNPIGFGHHGKEQTLCSVGFTPKPPPRTAPEAMPTITETGTITKAELPTPLASNFEVETVRIRDSDLDPAMFDQSTGEYFRPPSAAKRLHRHAADAWVAAAVSNRQVRQPISFSVKG